MMSINSISENYPAAFERWMITVTIMLVAGVEVLDMTIVNVALAPMMGSLGATSDQITWVLTSYIVSSAIFMLLTGLLDTRFGRRRLLLISILGFMFSSVFCGLASGLLEIVFFRALQGLFGASLVPLSQTIMRETFPPHEQGKAMAVWGIGIMVAPVLGPTLGGYITAHFDWRWVFYLNVPVCITSFFMALKFIKVTPTQKNSIDWLGMILMALGVGCLQIFLDRGNNVGWFQANSMVFLAITSFISLGYFITRGIKKSNNIINLKIFLDRNFSFCTLMLGIFGIGVLGIICIQPMLLQNYFGYSAETAGLVLAPKGIAAAVGMVLVATTINRFDPRKLMLIGLLIAIYGTYIMSNYNLQTSEFYWIWSGAIQGLGMGIFMIPLAALSLSTLSKELIAAGSGLFSFSRNLGMSIGISLLSTLITRESQTNWNQLGSHIDLLNPNLGLWLRQSGMQLTNPLALGELQHQLVFQSGMIAYVDSFRIVAICLLILIPGIFLLKKPDMGKGIEMPH